MIRARGLKAWYPSSTRPALNGLDVKVEPGEIAILAGPSGSGKTTALLAITGAMKHLLDGRVEGDVELSDVNPLTSTGFLRVPRMAGVVLQDPDKQLAMPTPLDEVSFNLENLGYPYEKAEVMALEALRAFGLEEKALASIEHLSGGEKRRVTLAAVHAVRPENLLMDEPTASLDPWAVGDVRRFTRDSAGRGVSVLIVEHKLRYFADMADKIIVVSDGNVKSAYRGGSRLPLGELERMGIDAMEPKVRGPGGNCREAKVIARDLVVGRGGRRLFEVEELRVCRGEVTALVGPNGSGKTTLLKLVAGAVKPLSGSLEVRGKTFYVPQMPDYIFLYPTVREDLLDAESRGGGKPWQALGRPEWLEEVAGLPGVRLSLGQRRFLSLAIAASYRPDVLLVDEPSAGLDLRLYSMLEKWLKGLSSQSGVLISTHDVRLIAGVADRVYMIRDGVMVEVDKHEAVESMETAWSR